MLSVVYWLLAIGYWLLAIGYWLLAIGYCLLAIVYCLLSIVYCLLAIGYCLLAEVETRPLGEAEGLPRGLQKTVAVAAVRRNSLSVVVKM
jgi:hypothetical protein